MHEADIHAQWLLLIPLLPLLGAMVNGALTLSGNPLSERKTALLGCLTVLGSALLATNALIIVLSHEEPVRLTATAWEWIASGRLSIPVSLVVDRLSALYITFICWIGLLIHIYSQGYMHGDKGFSRFFTYLNLFMFSMLTLVLGSSLPILFVGWEGVGLCSYLLIGFWYEGTENAKAGKKAFVVNRIGDFAFLLGMFVIFWGTWQLDHATLEVAGLQGQIAGLAEQTITLWGFSMRLPTVAAILLFIGACGKSAQIPLYVWLPDAMAGPTPVSALIHAATMVTAGIYMCARMHFLFSESPVALTLIAITGATTALFAASIALVQNDIKKVLAYSTVSQLGYMFMGIGAGAYAMGIFHVFTHAFFKACLFLGAGSVMHAMSNNTDIRLMGGLRKHMPHTWLTFLISTIAIAGVPGFSGFFSKDEILAKTVMNHGYFVPPIVPGHETLTALMPGVLWGMGVLAAFCTAFYMTRILYLTFHGEERWVEAHVPAEVDALKEAKSRIDAYGFEVTPQQLHPHESPVSMTGPLWVLAMGAIFAGYVGLPHFLGGHLAIEGWLGGIFDSAHAAVAEHGAHGAEAAHGDTAKEMSFAIISTVIAFAGIGAALFCYAVKPGLTKTLGDALSAVRRVLSNKYYIDEIYDFVFVTPIRRFSESVLWRVIDERVIDGTVRGVGTAARGLGGILSRAENGIVGSYAVGMLLGVVIILGYLALR